MHWPAMPLHAGDVVELKLMQPGEGDPPSETRRTSEDPRNLFASAENAAELVKIVSDFETRLMELVSRSEQTEPSEEFVKFPAGSGNCGLGIGRGFSLSGVPASYPSHAGRNEGRAAVAI